MEAVHTEKSISGCGYLWQAYGHSSSPTYTMTPTRGLPSGWYKYLGIAYLPRDNLTLETCYEIHDNLYDQIEHTREQFNF